MSTYEKSLVIIFCICFGGLISLPLALVVGAKSLLLGLIGGGIAGVELAYLIPWLKKS